MKELVVRWVGGVLASKELAFICETSVTAVSVVFNLTSSFTNRFFPCMFHFRFSSQYTDLFSAQFSHIPFHPTNMLLLCLYFLMSTKFLKLFLSSLAWYLLTELVFTCI